MKHYRTKLILLFVFVSMSCFGQGIERRVKLFKESFTTYLVPERLRDMKRLKKRTSTLINKNPHLSSMNGLRQYHILQLYPCGKFYGMKDYEDAEFLIDLEYGYYYIKTLLGRKKYMRDTTIITDSLGSIVAYGDACYLFIPSKRADVDAHDMYSELARLFTNGEIDMAFYTMQYPNRYICIKDENLYVLESDAGKLKFRDWKSFCSSLFCEDRDTNEH